VAGSALDTSAGSRRRRRRSSSSSSSSRRRVARGAKSFAATLLLVPPPASLLATTAAAPAALVVVLVVVAAVVVVAMVPWLLRMDCELPRSLCMKLNGVMHLSRSHAPVAGGRPFLSAARDKHKERDAFSHTWRTPILRGTDTSSSTQLATAPPAGERHISKRGTAAVRGYGGCALRGASPSPARAHGATAGRGGCGQGRRSGGRAAQFRAMLLRVFAEASGTKAVCLLLLSVAAAFESTRRLGRRLHLASGLLLRGLIAACGRGRTGQRLQRRREV
jgi:hypothetical protein